MKRLSLLLTTIIITLMAYSQVPKPDFAYPKTVSQNAEKDLTKAIVDNNAELALNALIRIYISNNLIDPMSTQNEILKLTANTATKFESDPLYGLFPAFLANIYTNIYQDSRWKFDSRDLPLTPYPDDVTEWSGKQFAKRIKDLCLQSIEKQNIDQLKPLDITHYADIVTVDELGAIFYPKLSDFVYYNCTNLLGQISMNEEVKNVFDEAYASSKGSIAPEILWISLIDMSESDQEASLMASYKKYRDSEYSGLLLTKYAEECNPQKDDNTKATLVEIAQEYVNKYPKSPFVNRLKNTIAECLNPEVTVYVPNIYPVGTIKLPLQITNATNFDIEAYYVGETLDNKRKSDWLQQYIKSHKPEKSANIVSACKVPFTRDTIAEITLDKSGYYVITASIKGVKTEIGYPQLTRLVPIVPFIIYDNNKADLIVVDARDGKPIEGAQVTIMSSSKEVIEGITDRDGIKRFTINNKNNYKDIKIKYQGNIYKFDDIRVYSRYWDNGDNDVRTSSILTDRSIYHQGEDINVLVVCSEAISSPSNDFKSELTRNQEISIELKDTNWQPVDTIKAKTDDYGRAIAKFSLPTDGLTGMYHIIVNDSNDRAIGNTSVIVSDYKMPSFEVKINTTEFDTPSKGDVTITGNATTYSGMPVANADVNINLDAQLFWFWRYRNPEKLYTVKTITDDQGNYKITLNDSIFKGVGQDYKHYLYNVTVDVVATSGEQVTATHSFSLGEIYNVTLSIDSKKVDGEKPFTPDIKVYNAEGQQVEIPLVWTLKSNNDTIASGEYYGPIDFGKIKPGNYQFSISAKEQGLSNDETANITIYNRKSGIVPNDEPLFIINDNIKLPVGADTVTIEYGTSNDLTYLYYVLDGNNGIDNIKVQIDEAGYHKLEVRIPDNIDMTVFKMFVVRDCKTYLSQIHIDRVKDSALKIEGESFRDNLIPGNKETWSIKVTNADGRPVESAIALDMYNHALDALYQHNMYLRFPTRPFKEYLNWSIVSTYDNTNHAFGAIKILPITELGSPSFNTYGITFASQYLIGRSMMKASRVSGLSTNSMEEAEYEMTYDMAAPVMSTAEAVTEDKIDDTKSDDFDYREAEVPIAIWEPQLTTDAEGNISYTFTVPNANTTWRLYAVAWSKDMKIGKMMRDFVASKPIMVQPNLPRFLRNGDKAVIVASVMNNTDSTTTVNTTIEIFDPVSSRIIKTETYENVISAKQTETLSIEVEANSDTNAIGYRIKSSNGDFADGEQSVILVLPSETSLIETLPFYLNPGDKEFETILPKADDARISLTFCENPAWTIVTALPGLRTTVNDYANSAAASLYSAAVAKGIIKDNPKIAEAIKYWAENPTDSTLVSMLEKNEDLKIAVLNSTPWVQAAQSDTERMANLALIFNDKEADSAINKAIDILAMLQKPDGGWAWGKWCDESSVWVTSAVLDIIGDLNRCGWSVKDKRLTDMTKKAVKYYDSKVKDTDMLYCLIRPMFANIKISENGQKVINATIKEINKMWKKYDPTYKAMAAEALYLNGNKDMARTLMGSLSEFGVYTKDQGLKFPSVNSLTSYAIILQAYSLIMPDSKEVDGLRQQLIIRKQATDWGSAVVTTEVVKAILSSGNKWTVDAEKVNITVGNHQIEPTNNIEKYTGDLRADISEYAGKRLTVKTSGTGPSYGAIYTQYNQKMDSVKAYSCEDLSIEKVTYVRQGSDWAIADSLKVGDRVKVQLTIHTNRNLQYVSIIDERPASFSPVEQLPGWIWSEGVAFYRENRDSQTDMHVIYMRLGTYLLTYEMNVTMAGTYSSGVATIQSQYVPEITAHSGGQIINVR